MRRRAEYAYGDEIPLVMGGIAAIGHPYDCTDEEIEQLAAEVEERERRRRPIGFVKWDTEQEGTDVEDPRRGKTTRKRRASK